MKIVFKHPDNSIIEMFCFSKEKIEENLKYSLSDEEYKKHHLNNIPVGSTSIIILEDNFYMGDYFFRDAWSDLNEDGTVVIDFEKARIKILKIIEENLKKVIIQKNYLSEIKQPYDDIQSQIEILIQSTIDIKNILFNEINKNEKLELLKNSYKLIENYGE